MQRFGDEPLDGFAGQLFGGLGGVDGEFLQDTGGGGGVDGAE